MKTTFQPEHVALTPEELKQATEFKGKLTTAGARALLQIRFSEKVETYMRQLLKKAKAGTATAKEHEQMDAYCRMACMLDILHSRARRALTPVRATRVRSQIS